MTEFEPNLVSTIIPVHNRPHLIRDAVESVLNQSHRPIQIVIVDDGSTDETPDVIRDLARRNNGLIETVHGSRSGPGAARELGRGRARGEFIQYLDSDDLLLPNKFERQVAGLRESPQCQVSYGKTRCYDYGEPPEDIPCKRTGERIETMFPSFLQSRWWSTSTPLFRRTVTDRAGPWEPLWNEEDWEYDCRIAATGARLHYCPEFVSDTRRGRNDQLCADGNRDPLKLAHRARANELIYGHAVRYGIRTDSGEMRHFARELFLLSRQCGGAGLHAESLALFNLARDASGPVRSNRLDFRLYGLALRTLGSRNAALIAKVSDHLRK